MVTEPVEGSGAWPAWIARVENPRFFGSPFTVVSSRVLPAEYRVAGFKVYVRPAGF